MLLSVSDIVTKFGSNVVHNGISFDLGAGEIVGLIGSSGSGKSVLMREIIGLLEPTAGNVQILGTDVWQDTEEAFQIIKRQVGVLFQQGALFSGLTVAENVALPLREINTPDYLIETIVAVKLELSGFHVKDKTKYPSELSGGMLKRAALARAIALDPKLLILDEPTSGLDPITARAFDRLIRELSDGLGISILMVTHDLDSINGIVERLIVLSDTKKIADDSLAAVKENQHPWIQSYFNSIAKSRG